MNSSAQLPHLLFVVGTTGCGKSDLAVEISESLKDPGPQPEIINSDSVSFFEAVQIGAAKPSAELLSRAPHHLVGHVSRNGSYTAGHFRRDSLKVLAQRSPFVGRFLVVGGSGFYTQALEKGMYDVPVIDPQVRMGLAEEASLPEGMAALHRELVQRDPESAERIKSNDHYRILRALEVLRSETRGWTLNEIKADFDSRRPLNPFTFCKIGLFRSREVLRQKITERTHTMMEQGLVDEVKALRAENLGSWSPMQSVGYKEVQAYLDGTLPLADLEPAIVTSTMQLAKQQRTWFNRDPAITWFETDTQWREAVKTGHDLLQRS